MIILHTILLLLALESAVVLTQDSGSLKVTPQQIKKDWNDILNSINSLENGTIPKLQAAMREANASLDTNTKILTWSYQNLDKVKAVNDSNPNELLTATDNLCRYLPMLVEVIEKHVRPGAIRDEKGFKSQIMQTLDSIDQLEYDVKKFKKFSLPTSQLKLKFPPRIIYPD